MLFLSISLTAIAQNPKKAPVRVADAKVERIFAGLASTPDNPPQAAEAKSDAKKARKSFRIMIDPGRGGEDNGAKGPKGLIEKDIALGLAKRLQTALNGRDCEVLLSRETDQFIPLWERAKLANDAQADLFISLHLNAARFRGAKGSEVYFLSLDQGDADAAAVAALENAGNAGPSSEAAQVPKNALLDSILQDLAQKAYLQESERLAVLIQQQLNRLGGIKQRGVKQAPFVVLRGAAMPAVLVEVGFISNPKESAKFRDIKFQRKVAEVIATAVRRYIARGVGTPRRQARSNGDTPQGPIE